MSKFSASFLEKDSKELVYLTANKIEDITQGTLDKKFYKEEVSYIPVFKSIRDQHIGTFSRKKYFLLKLKKKRFNPYFTRLKIQTFYFRVFTIKHPQRLREDLPVIKTSTDPASPVYKLSLINPYP